MVEESHGKHVLHQTSINPKQKLVIVILIVAEVHCFSQLLPYSSLRLYVLRKRVSLCVVEEQRVAKVANLLI